MTFIFFFYYKTKTPAEAGVADSIATITSCPLPLRVKIILHKNAKNARLFVNKKSKILILLLHWVFSQLALPKSMHHYH